MSLTPTLCFTEFNSTLIKQAENVVTNYVINYLAGDFDPDPYQEGFIAVPNLFTFYFSADEGYKSLKPEVVYNTRFPYETEDENDDPLVDFDSSRMYCAIFFQGNYDGNIPLGNLFEPLLPNCLMEVDGMAFVVSPSENQDITLLEIMNLLLSKGFIYDKENCDFKEIFQDLEIVRRVV